jgi:hypothetical protein
MEARRTARGPRRSRADRLGAAPARAAKARRTPMKAPAHQVARIPQPRARRVGSSVAKTFGWKTVKYSRQMRMVTWSWTMP